MLLAGTDLRGYGMNNKNEGHRERLRDKFLQHGLDKFTDEEILELLLTLATPRQDCKQRARALLKQFGNLAFVLEAEAAQLAEIEGIGPKNILGLKLIPAVARRYLANKVQAMPSITDFSQLSSYLRMTMGGLGQEVFRVIMLDSRQRICGVEDLFQGTIDKAAVYPREVIKAALSHGASLIICAHNHPSGNVEPGQLDIDLTRKLYYACRAVDIKLWDHLIVGRQAVFSFAQNGTVRQLELEYNILEI